MSGCLKKNPSIPVNIMWKCNSQYQQEGTSAPEALNDINKTMFGGISILTKQKSRNKKHKHDSRNINTPEK